MKRVRDLSKAITLRPKDVFDLYGIPVSTLSDMLLHPDPEKRLPSSLIPGRKGRKGHRLIYHADVRAFVAKYYNATATAA